MSFGTTLRAIGRLLLVSGAGALPLRAQSTPDYELPPIQYSTAQPHDAVDALQRRLASGDLLLTGSDREIVQTLLRELKVPGETQVVVFSKTSLQRGRIRPDHPRALYFSDSIYIGWVPGGLIEAAAIDPVLGPVFYAFDPRGTAGSARKFERDSDCLRCHGGTFVRGVPGVFARSLVPDDSGEPLLRHGSELVDDETPFEKRWGGWYVTGYTGSENHRGNAFGSEAGDDLVFRLNQQRPTELSRFFDTAAYLRDTSDAAALLVFEHQLAMQNSLTRAGQSCRKMLEYQRSLQKTLNDPVTDEPSYDSVKSVFASAVEDVVDHLLFRGAAPIPDGVVMSDAFRTGFTRGAPRSKSGLALKDLQLRGRIFTRRCSYLIYSESFASLPPQLKDRILDRLGAVLRGEDPKGRYAYLEATERSEIMTVLRETLPAAKAWWQRASSSTKAE